MWCSKCGRETPENCNFCPYCGNAVRQTCGVVSDMQQSYKPSNNAQVSTIKNMQVVDDYKLNRAMSITRSTIRHLLTAEDKKTGKPRTVIKNVLLVHGGDNANSFNAVVEDNILYINYDGITTGKEIFRAVVPALTRAAAKRDESIITDILAYAKFYKGMDIDTAKQNKKESLMKTKATQSVGYNNSLSDSELLEEEVALDIMCKEISRSIDFYGVMNNENRTPRQKFRDACEQMLVNLVYNDRIPDVEKARLAECERIVKRVYAALKY